MLCNVKMVILMQCNVNARLDYVGYKAESITCSLCLGLVAVVPFMNFSVAKTGELFQSWHGRLVVH